MSARTTLTRRDVFRLFACVSAVTPRALRGQSPVNEILIRGGQVVNHDGISEADVRIVGETIAEVRRGLRPTATTRVLEARGHLVVPGGIDPHTHLHPSFVDDMTTGSQAALAGGITTVGTFAAAGTNETVLAAMDRLAERVRIEAIADVILHGSSWPPGPEFRAALEPLAMRGQPSIKVYMTRPDFGGSMSDVIQMLEAARDAGVLTLIHCEDGAMLGAAVRRLEASGQTSLEHYAASRPVGAEVAATQTAVALCESTGAPVYLVHISSRRALDVCREGRRRHLPVYTETRPLYLHLTEERMARPDAALYVGQPPLRSADDQQALWAGLADGTIDVLATDHAPWTREQKLDPLLSITRLRPGVSDLQFMLPMYFSEGVRKRRLPLERFVATTSTNAARIFGLFPRKGMIRQGSDADVVIWDPKREGTVTAAADYSRSDYSVYEGWPVVGWPITAIRRGRIVFEDGKLAGSPGSGQLLPRTTWRPN